DAPPQDAAAAAAGAPTASAAQGPATPLVTDEADDAPTAEERARARRLTQRTRIVVSVSSVLSTAMVVGGFYLFGPGSDRDPGRDDRAAAPSSTPSAPSVDPVEDATPGPEESPEKETSLLTPESVRRIVSELEKVMGTTKVTAFDVHQSHASAKAPLQRDPKLWDTYEYRDGKAVRARAGGVVRDSDAVVDLDRFDWDALPGLMAEAEKRLGVEKPENRYFIVDPASPFHDKQPVLRLYLSDEYGGGYLTADLDGKVIDVSPRS
ncbi:serine/threonine protein kinase, partial [Streptomyces albidoflavus]|nr:serine/threonine protein kinase [Streptomyces albidoflavus]